MESDARGTLVSLLQNYDHVITYQPLRTEVDISFLTSDLQKLHVIPPRAGLDPLEIAREMKSVIGYETALILIPGKRFDASGTRHGQGGGWYDRFLAKVPREWIRMGFCFTDQLSPTPLVRESWDQAMDYVVAVDRTTGSASVYSTESHD